MKCHIQFSGKNEKNIINLSSAEFAQREVRVKLDSIMYHGLNTKKTEGFGGHPKIHCYPWHFGLVIVLCQLLLLINP